MDNEIIVGGTRDIYQQGILGKTEENRNVILNLNNVNTMSIFGIQGSGKSYSIGIITEMAVKNFSGINTLNSPLGGIIFHYSESEDYPPEFTSMNIPNNHIFDKAWLKADYGAIPEGLNDILVLVPKGKLQKRKEEYPDLEVQPVTFSSSEIGISGWLFLLGATNNKSLYVDHIKAIIRDLRSNLTFQTIEKAINHSSYLDRNQLKRAKSRLSLAREFINDDISLREQLVPGRLIIVDMRDELIEKEFALSLGLIMLNVFADSKNQVGERFNKIFVFDEAHKYMGNQKFTDTIVTNIRQMRHEGVNVLIASQDPMSLPMEIISLSSIVILHKMNSPAWLKHIKKSVIQLSNVTESDISTLRPGEAYLWSNESNYELITREAIKIKTRPRCTKHGGTTVKAYNSGPEPLVSLPPLIDEGTIKTVDSVPEPPLQKKYIYHTPQNEEKASFFTPSSFSATPPTPQQEIKTDEEKENKLEKYLEEAEELYDEDDFEEALKVLENCENDINSKDFNVEFYCLRKDEVYCLRGKILYHLERYKESLVSLNTALKNSVFYYDDAYYWRGLTKYELDDFDGAIDDFREAIALDRDESRYYYWLGSAFKMKELNHEALYYYDKAIKIDPHFSRPYVSKIEVYLSLDDIDSAIAECKIYFEKIFPINNAEFVPIDEMGDGVATADLLVIWRRFIDYAIHWTMDTENHDKALKAFKMSLEIADKLIDRDNWFKCEALPYLVSLYSTKKDYPNAIKLCEKYLSYEDGTHHSFVYEKLIEIYEERLDYKQSLYYCDKLIELEPDKHHFELRGKIYLEKKELNKALKDFDTALDLSKSDSGYWVAGIWFQKSKVHIMLNKFQEAINNLAHAIKLENKNSDYLLLRAKCYYKINNLDKAKEDLDSVIKIKPDVPDAYILQALIHKNKSNKKLATNDLLNAIGLGSNIAKSLVDNLDINTTNFDFGSFLL